MVRWVRRFVGRGAYNHMATVDRAILYPDRYNSHMVWRMALRNVDRDCNTMLVGILGRVNGN